MIRSIKYYVIWDFVANGLKAGRRMILLYVLDSEGSSPGRKGFCMVLSQDGSFSGTIGGGIMEVKLLELARDRLRKGEQEVLVKKQYHDKQHASGQSGMICSGAQTVALVPLDSKDAGWVDRLMKGTVRKIGVRKSGVVEAEEKEVPEVTDREEGLYFEIEIQKKRRVHIFGGGHVGLALSQILSILEYEVLIYDDRPELNTLLENQWADETKIIDYGKAGEEIAFAAGDAAVIVTFSYRTDKLLLKQLYDQPFSYLGLMGSEAKVATLYRELAEEGIGKEALSAVFAPVGLEIFSKTAREIAVSIAGQMIRETNRELPTGRTYK